MFASSIGLIRLTLIFGLSLIYPLAVAAGIEQQRAVFRQAEQALARENRPEADALLAELSDYPLYPHLLYKRLALDLDNAAAIRAFLSRYPQSRQAELLRTKWLERLAAGNAWGEFAGNYRPTDNPGLQCDYYLALANLGRRDEAFAGAEKMWPDGSTLPESCERLFSVWQDSKAFTVEQVWKRFSAALRKANLLLASHLRRLLPEDQKAVADGWLKVHENPHMVLSCSGWTATSPASGRIFAHAVDRLAADAPLLAQTAWSLHKARFDPDPALAAYTERRLALALATQRYDQAAAYLLTLPREVADAQTRAWRVRASLLKQDWLAVLTALDLLEPAEKTQAQWRYWRARTLEALEDRQTAFELFRQLAKEPDFYGYMAADRVALDYPLVDRPSAISEAELNRLASLPPFPAIAEFRALDRTGEAHAEWLHAIKSLSPRDLMVAAKLAQQWGWDQIAIVTVAKSGSWDDLSLRFPLGFQQTILQQAQARQLDPAMLFGLIRRESAFDPRAGSAAGARGLMQLMPATGDQLALRFNEKPPAASALYDPERNIRYGSAYMRGLLDRFGNRFALAAAAYNAGPGRVDRWLPATRPLPADIWIETIPFNETRQYVGAVLSYAVAYQLRLGRPEHRIAAFLQDIPPGPKADVKADRVVPINLCE